MTATGRPAAARPGPANGDRPARPPGSGALVDAARAAAPAAESDPSALRRWLEAQRWFPSDEDDVGAGEVVAVRSVALPARPGGTEPSLRVAIAETAGGRRFQLLLPGRAPALDLGADTSALSALARFVAAARSATEPGVGTVAGHWVGGATPLGDGATRPLGGEQSNTSAVVGGTHVLKLFRRVHAGPHPEVEVGRHLATVDTSLDVPVASLAGWYDLTDDDGSTALGVVQDLVAGALDGWELVLGSLAADPPGSLHLLHALGGAVARLHDGLALPARDRAPGTADDDPAAFGRTPLGRARIDAVVQGVAADARRHLATTLDRPLALGAVAGRADEVAALAGALAAQLGDDLGAAIRHHGDLHLGQVVHGADGWVILDFEGEPNRPLAERRERHSPLRDVAGMLRSLAYAAATRERAGMGRLSPGWLPAARAAFLDGYLAEVDPGLVPSSAVATRRLLSLFELEKVVYEIGYELGHRPDWVDLPVRGLVALLRTGPAAGTTAATEGASS